MRFRWHNTASVDDKLKGKIALAELTGSSKGQEIMVEENRKPVKQGDRLISIDALRGFDMFWIIGGDALAIKLLSQSNWEHAGRLKEQFEHVAWEGFRFYDLIFPLFLFLLGCVIPFSLEKFHGNPTQAVGRVLKRTGMLLILALLYNDILQFQFSTMRYAGVLQRLAICYGICSLLYLFVPLRGRVLAAVAILLGYWAMMVWVPVPGGVAGDLSPAGNLSGYIDRTYLPGRILKDYYGFGDNEGILSTIPAIVTGLLGVFAGEWLRSQRGPAEKCFGLAAAGGVLLVVGTIWGQFFPVIKNLWTSSFVLVAGGYSLLLLSLFYALLDWMQWRWWAWFWVVIGSNAILIYMIREIIDFTKISKYFLGGIASWSGPWQGVVIQAGSLAAMWLLLYWLYRRKIFLRA